MATLVKSAPIQSKLKALERSANLAREIYPRDELCKDAIVGTTYNLQWRATIRFLPSPDRFLFTHIQRVQFQSEIVPDPYYLFANWVDYDDDNGLDSDHVEFGGDPFNFYWVYPGEPNEFERLAEYTETPNISPPQSNAVDRHQGFLLSGLASRPSLWRLTGQIIQYNNPLVGNGSGSPIHKLRLVDLTGSDPRKWRVLSETNVPTGVFTILFRVRSCTQRIGLFLVYESTEDIADEHHDKFFNWYDGVFTLTAVGNNITPLMSAGRVSNKEFLFSDISIGGPVVSRLWTIDGKNYDVQQPRHVFSSTGDKSISLMATNAYGFSDTATARFQVTNQPTLKITYGPPAESSCGGNKLWVFNFILANYSVLATGDMTIRVSSVFRPMVNASCTAVFQQDFPISSLTAIPASGVADADTIQLRFFGTSSAPQLARVTFKFIGAAFNHEEIVLDVIVPSFFGTT